MLAAVQAFIVAAVPSVGTPTGSALDLTAPYDPGDGGSSTTGIDPSSETTAGGTVPGAGDGSNGTDGETGDTVDAGGGPQTGGGGASDTFGRDPREPGAWPWSHPWTLAGDRSKCAAGGQLQETIGLVSAPCVPAFVGDNGGATYPGVTATSVTVVLYRFASNPAVDAILGQQNLAASEQQDREAFAAFGEFFNKRYELYGRKIDWIFYAGQCDGTNPACVREEARTIVSKHHPFYVIADASVVPELHDELSRLGVVNSGGWHFHPSFRVEHRPFTYDLYPDGLTAARHTAGYWCSKMAGGKATRAGSPTLTSLDRKIGIVTQGFPVFKKNAEELVTMVRQCGSTDVPIVTYNYDIARAQEQMAAVVTALKKAGVTTVTCLCDPVMPAFLTQAADQQQYFPEWLVSGLPAMSHDFLGRLYSPLQWANAFGPSMRPQEVAQADSDHEKAWRDVGRSGHPAYLTLNRFMWVRFAAMQIQMAGPNLTPLTIERGTLDSPQLGGFSSPEPWPGWKCCNPFVEAMRFGPGDYTGHEDAKDVVWDANARSPVDGKPGAYVCVEAGCPRFFPDQWRTGQPSQPNR